jgi:hypothetical protein
MQHSMNMYHIVEFASVAPEIAVGVTAVQVTLKEGLGSIHILYTLLLCIHKH